MKFTNNNTEIALKVFHKSVNFLFILDPVPAPDLTRIRPEPDICRKAGYPAGTGTGSQIR